MCSHIYTRLYLAVTRVFVSVADGKVESGEVFTQVARRFSGGRNLRNYPTAQSPVEKVKKKSWTRFFLSLRSSKEAERGGRERKGVSVLRQKTSRWHMNLGLYLHEHPHFCCW